jgi:hypothetical protein
MISRCVLPDFFESKANIFERIKPTGIEHIKPIKTLRSKGRPKYLKQINEATKYWTTTPEPAANKYPNKEFFLRVSEIFKGLLF